MERTGLKEKMAACGLTVAEVSRRAGISRTLLADTLNGIKNNRRALRWAGICLKEKECAMSHTAHHEETLLRVAAPEGRCPHAKKSCPLFEKTISAVRQRHAAVERAEQLSGSLEAMLCRRTSWGDQDEVNEPCLFNSAEHMLITAGQLRALYGMARALCKELR